MEAQLEVDSNWPTTDKARDWRHRARHKSLVTERLFQEKITSLRKKRRTRLKETNENELKCAIKTASSRLKRFELPPKRSQCNLVAVLVILFYCSFDHYSSASGSGSILLTSANELFASQPQPQPEAQPLVYMLHEMGSGEGSRNPSYSRASSSGSDQTSSSSTDADVAPALIEARCWNNYENDNDCKQLNVITAPQSERQNQQQQQQMGEDDSLITPVVIFEASSSIETTLDNEIDSERPLFMAPPYQPNEIPQPRLPANTRKQHKQHEQSSTSNPMDGYAATPRQSEANFEPPPSPVTRPTVIHYVATPQPKSLDGASRRPHTKVTTQGRKCRDENDADCDDEDDDNQIQSSNNLNPAQSAGDNDDRDDEDDDENDDEQEADDNKNDRIKSTSTTSVGGGGGDQTSLINESGSGLGPSGTGDDNDDSTDDGDGDSTGDSSESSGTSSIQENSSRISDNNLLTITSSYPQELLTESNGDHSHSSTSTPNSVLNTRRPQSGAAEIEVVVHSTLPPSFPVNSIGQERSRSKAAYDEFVAMISTTTTTTTTMIPDEIYTSKPIFPSSTFAPINSPEDDQRTTKTSQAGQTTTELDLYTFKPVPIPVEQSEIRPSRFEFGGSGQSSGNSGGSDLNGHQQGEQDQGTGPAKHEVSSQHIHETPSHRRPFDDGWTTRKPLGSMMNLGKDQFNQQNQSPDIFPSDNRAQAKSYNYMTTETLPTMLLYASIIVTVFISLILVVIYSLWRRNSLRRRALLAKAHMMNGRPPAGMIESMSHVSHLMHGADGLQPQQPPQPPPPQQGLLSTYARAKGSTIGKVTTSLVKPIDQSASGLLGQELDEEDEDQRAFKDESRDQLVIEEENSSLEETQNQQQMRVSRLTNGINDNIHNRSGSWSTEDPTTTTSSGSQRTQDSQQPVGNRQQGAPMQNGQRLHHPYPNSLSDGRQNSSSISDSQCSPDPQPPGGGVIMNPMHHQPMTMPSNQAHTQSLMHNNHSIDHRELVAASPLHSVGHHPHHHQQQQSPYGHYPQQLQQPFIRPILRAPPPPPPQQLGNGLQRMGPVRLSSMLPAGQIHHPMMVQNGGLKGPRQRLVASRSIEDITPSQHVGFIDHNNNQSQLPYNQHQQVLPQLIQARPNYQYSSQQIANMNASSTIRNPMIISPHRIAMSPLATLSRRFPPGAGLNRNIYSEDSSSFITASPSLARTSSSSSFAFNLSNLPTPSSIKARPLVDTSGRVFNDYTHGLNDHSSGVGNGNADESTAPPVFARTDRSEAWYV